MAGWAGLVYLINSLIKVMHGHKAISLYCIVENYFLIEMINFKVGDVVMVECSKELNKSGKQKVTVVLMSKIVSVFNGKIESDNQTWTFANDEVIKVLKSGFVFR